MARDHARIQVDIWSNDDFRALSAAAQHAYMLLVSQPRLSYCGVIDYLPSRLATLATDLSSAGVQRAVKALEKRRFVVVDRDTHELLIRTYVRHDGVMQRTNMGKAMGRALSVVISDKIRRAIYDELTRYYAEESGLAGWIGFKSEHPEAFAIVSGEASAMALPIASEEA